MLGKAFFVVALVAALSLTSFAPPAGAVTERIVARHVMPTLEHARESAPLTTAAAAQPDLVYHGGAIEKLPSVYIVYWGWHLAAPDGNVDPAGVAPYLEAFFAGVGGSAWAGVQTQYGETSRGLVTNPTGQLAGVWYDDEPTVPPLPDALIENEVARAVSHFGYHRDANYIIVSPHLFGDAGFTSKQYCAWHSSTVALGRPVAYTNLPYIPDAGAGCGANFVNKGAAGALDGVSIVAGHEYAEAVTDPFPASGWVDPDGWENADKCAWDQGPGAKAANVHLPTGDFAVQSLWSNAVHACALA